MLFYCVSNAARSQLAEAVARHLRPEVEAWSAGAAPSHVRPQVSRVLQEVGISSVGLRAKALGAVPVEDIDLAVTLCAEWERPVFPSSLHRLSWPLPDPASAPADESMEAFRATRDELLRRLPPLLDRLARGERP